MLDCSSYQRTVSPSTTVASASVTSASVTSASVAASSAVSPAVSSAVPRTAISVPTLGVVMVGTHILHASGYRLTNVGGPSPRSIVFCHDVCALIERLLLPFKGIDCNKQFTKAEEAEWPHYSLSLRRVGLSVWGIRFKYVNRSPLLYYNQMLIHMSHAYIVSNRDGELERLCGGQDGDLWGLCEL